MRPLAATLLAVSTATAAPPDGIELFEKNVRPILVEHCHECHATDKKQKGGLLLDSRAGWEKGGDSGPAIVPGKPDESLLIKAIRYTDRDLQMPEKRKLPAAQIAILEEWVRLGAPDPREAAVAAKKQTGMTLEAGREFWAYKPPTRPAIPAVRNTAWPRNDIDRFILARIEAAGLAPAPDAAPATFARRLSLSITGLPPAPTSQIPNPQLSTALLASPHFGEHFGRHWLDVARFAESSGGGRTLLFKDAWRYRDYVIQSLNNGIPLDRFIREQIAGDLLPAKDEQEKARLITATAFLALGPTNYEEQDKQQLRFDVIDEQLDTIGKTLLGQTIGCARCHDHKFDPINQRDYYGLAGIFASTRTLHNYTDNVARWVDSPLPAAAADSEKYAAAEKRIPVLKKEIADAKKDRPNPKTDAIAAVADFPALLVDDADTKPVGKWEISQRIKTYIGTGYLTDQNENKGACTVTFAPKIPTPGRYEVRLAYVPGAGRASNVPVHILHADGESDVVVDQTQPPPIAGRFATLGTFRFEKDGAGYVLISNEGTNGYVIADAVHFIPADAPAPAIATAPEFPIEESPNLRQLKAELKNLETLLARKPTAMSVREIPEEISGTHIRVRGLVHQRGDLIPRAMPAVFPGPQPVFSDSESGRRQFADWLTAAENPLTARVIVNRVWHWLFGRGLVASVDNFGTTGDLPSHPELLDFLAVEFIAHGWDLKWLVREITTSRTFAQRAAAPPPTDPDNRLLSVFPRRRLTADQLRDTMLVASGELDLTALGPNITGAGIIDANDTGAQNIEYRYEFADTRRSVYTPAFRNRRHDIFEAFDFGNINSPLGARETSTVAPQALFMMNHPWVRARAAAAAQNHTATAGDIPAAIRRTLHREPTAAEQTRIASYVAQHGDTVATRTEIFHTLFASLDFRYLD